MANKPGQLAHPRAGQAVGACENLAATLNWLISCMANLDVGEGLTLSGVENGQPVIELDNDDGGDSSGGLSFVSADDSNVVVTDEGGGTYKIGVYWL